MKTRNFILTAALLMTGSLAGDLLAQANLNALMKKCESMEKVNVDVIYDKDRKTKKPVKEVIRSHFRERIIRNCWMSFSMRSERTRNLPIR